MRKKTLAAFAGAIALAVPLSAAAAGPASAAAPVYHHTIQMSSHSYIYWDRNWPYPNRAVQTTNHKATGFTSLSNYPGTQDTFYTTAALPGNSYLDGVHEEADINTKEIPGSGGRVSVHFDNRLGYGSCGAAEGCWSNLQAANFTINANGTAYYELISDHGDGTWGETDIVVKNVVW
jgi:hypothetical protein